jgi:flagellin
MANQISLTSAMRTNLSSLQDTANLIEKTQTRLSTGKKVNSAIDNAVNYFLARNFTNNASDLGLAKDNMATAIQVVTAADTGITAISSLIDAAKSIATSAKSASTTTDVSTYADQFKVLLTQIDNIANTTKNDAAFNGTNLLNSATTTLSVDLGSSSTLVITGFDATAYGLTITSTVGLGTVATSWTSNGGISSGAIAASISQIGVATSTLRIKSQGLSANLSVVEIRQQFATTMINTFNKGADNLTLADMNEEGANMLALQTRQSLGITSLSLASQANQAVLQLFG